MIINDYILKEIKPLTSKNTVKEARNLCRNLPVTHVLIVEENRLIGCFSESDIQTLEDKSKTLSSISYLLNHFHATKETTLLELIKLFADNNCNVISVLDKKQNYLGYYELSDVLDVFTDSPFLYHENETLIVEKDVKDFSMSEVAQIVETNKGVLKGMFISSETTQKVQVNLQIVSEEINEIIQTFRRYEYHVVTVHEDDFYLEDLKNRSEYLQKYLDI